MFFSPSSCRSDSRLDRSQNFGWTGMPVTVILLSGMPRPVRIALTLEVETR
ncbi:hypothetical protein D3C85_1933180 [compost metagenome]